jgi:hypothetical protein
MNEDDMAKGNFNKITTLTDNECCVNTDKEIWREKPGDFYADSVHVTEHNGIGINCGGCVIVCSLKNWFKVADLIYNSELRNVSQWRKKLALWLLKADKPIKYPKM